MIVTVPGVDWQDLRDGMPSLRRVMNSGALANVAVRVSNRPAHTYSTLGAGERMQAPASSGWAFDTGETVENGTAADLYRRRTGLEPSGQVLVTSMDQITRGNVGKAFNARPGELARLLSRRGIASGAIGNADHSLGRLPQIFPDHQSMTSDDPPETGIHREIALIAMEPTGTVAVGKVGRDLLEEDAASPFRVRANRRAVIAEVDRIWPQVGLLAIETGDTGRADSAVAAGWDPRVKAAALASTDALVADLLTRIDPDQDLLLLLAPTTPGGPEARGRLRPALLWGKGISAGLMMSGSTRRPGLVTMPDLTATIADAMGLVEGRLGAGRAVRIVPEQKAIPRLDGADAAAASHDKARNPWAALFLLGVVGSALLSWRRSSFARMAWLSLLASVAGSYASKASPGTLGWLGVLAVALASSLIFALVSFRLAGRSYNRAAMLIMSVTAALIAADLVTGSHLQLDSLLGYTSVAAGRYFGLGNLGFAALAAASFPLLASLPTGWGYAALGAGVTLALIGHPSLGDDVGGTLAIVVGLAAFYQVRRTGHSIRWRHVPLVLGGALLVILVLGSLDMLRGAASRTHLGDLLAQLISDPYGAWLVVRRKALLAVTIGVTNLWGVCLIPGIFMLIKMKGAIGSDPRTRAVVQAVVATAIAGAALNDSGIAIAGLAISLLCGWLILTAEETPRRATSG